jgi:hypothetical protein
VESFLLENIDKKNRSLRAPIEDGLGCALMAQGTVDRELMFSLIYLYQATEIVSIAKLWKTRRWKLILWFVIPGVAASIAGAYISVEASQTMLLRVLGAFLLAYVAFLFVKPTWKLPHKNSVVASGGLASGFAAGIFGVGGAIRAAVLTAFNLQKEVFLFTSGFTALFIDFSRIAAYVAGGTRLQDIFLWGLLLFIPLSFLGAWIAKKLVHRVSQRYFRFVIAVFLGIAGLKFFFIP